MPRTAIRIYPHSSGEVFLLDWLGDLKKTNRKAYAKCLGRIRLLEEKGYELRRPIADHLDDGISELRTEHLHVNYRILYFSCGPNAACLSHGCTKKGKVPQVEIELAKTRRNLVNRDLDRYTVVWPR